MNGNIAIVSATLATAKPPENTNEPTKTVIKIELSHEVLPNALKPQSSSKIASYKSNLPYAIEDNSNIVTKIYLFIFLIYLCVKLFHNKY